MLEFQDENGKQVLRFDTEEVEDKSISLFPTERKPEYYSKVYDENDQLIDEFQHSNLRDRVYYYKGYMINKK